MAARRGIWYERRVQERFLSEYSGRYIGSPWFRFWRRNGTQGLCQPDGLLFSFDKGFIVIVEIKHSHTVDAWFQLTKLYLPVVEAVFPPRLWRYSRIEVTKTFDPHERFPEPLRIVSDLEEGASLGALVLRV